MMDSKTIESEHSHLTVVSEPEKANLVFDTVRNSCYHFADWTRASKGIEVHLDDREEHTLTVLPYVLPTNRYYFVQSESFENHR